MQQGWNSESRVGKKYIAERMVGSDPVGPWAPGGEIGFEFE